MRTRTAVAAAAFYTALTLVLTWPFSTELTTHVLSVGTDMDLAIWSIGWNVHKLTHQPWSIFDANIFHPFHNTLAYSENLIGSSLLAAPVIWLTGNTILGMNLVALFSVAAGAFGAFLLARRLGLSAAAALLAGIVWGFTPPRFFRMDQLPISSVQWIPFALWALHAYFDTRRSRYLKIAVAVYSLQALTSGHGAAMLTLAIGMLLVWKWWHGEPLAIVRRLRDIGWQGGLSLVPAALIYIPYKLAQVEVGLKRELDDWTLSTPSFFASPSLVDRWIVQQLPDFSWLKGEPDAWLFPGLVPLVLATLALWHHAASAAPDAPHRGFRRLAVALEIAAAGLFALAVWVTLVGGIRLKAGATVWFSAHGGSPWLQLAAVLAIRSGIRRFAPFAPGPRAARARAWLATWRQSFNTPDHLWFYAALFLMSMWLAIGPPLGIWRVMYWMPGLNFVRMPSRFTVVGLLGLGIVVASGFDRLTARASAAVKIGAATLCGLLLVVEFAALPMTSEPYAVEPLPVDRWIATQPEPMALLEMPLSDSQSVPNRERWTTRFMLHSMAHWKPLFVGFSGIQPPGYQDNYWTLVKFPDAESLALARRLGLTHVILHTSLVDPTERQMFDDRFAAFADQVRLVHTEGEGRVYAIRP